MSGLKEKGNAFRKVGVRLKLNSLRLFIVIRNFGARLKPVFLSLFTSIQKLGIRKKLIILLSFCVLLTGYLAQTSVHNLLWTERCQEAILFLYTTATVSIGS